MFNRFVKRFLPLFLCLILFTACTQRTSPEDVTKNDAAVTENTEQDTYYKEEEYTQTETETETHNAQTEASLSEDGSYTAKDEVALYIHLYGKLPSNFITKKEARDLGWESSKGNLNKVAPGKSIGGDKFGNREGNLPKGSGIKYYECDIGYTGGRRGAERIVYSNKGKIYYTNDHYATFEELY